MTYRGCLKNILGRPLFFPHVFFLVGIKQDKKKAVPIDFETASTWIYFTENF